MCAHSSAGMPWPLSARWFAADTVQQLDFRHYCHPHHLPPERERETQRERDRVHTCRYLSRYHRAPHSISRSPPSNALQTVKYLCNWPYSAHIERTSNACSPFFARSPRIAINFGNPQTSLLFVHDGIRRLVVCGHYIDLRGVICHDSPRHYLLCEARRPCMLHIIHLPHLLFVLCAL